jgi:quercetin dioxygenase-like cupin family protein
LELSTLLVEATSFEMATAPAGWSGEWRAAPQRQLLFVRTGRLEVTSSAGERRRFGPGQLLLIGDTAGRSHRMRNVGRGTCELLIAQLG